MDKYEFNIKVEQIKKMVSRSDYETAMKIADTIDWRRVRNVNILSMVATIYEKNEEYQEAKDILLLAFERAPIGKRLLYKLAELALKGGNLREAEDYYREFCDLASDDPRQYLLRYQILGAKGAPVEQLIHTLEQYCNIELDEKWLYELATLYGEAGMGELCIMACDKIMLMFGLGKYVDKAMELKIQFAPLTKYQMDLVENRDKYEAKLRKVEQDYRGGGPMEDYDEAPKKPAGSQHSRDRVQEEAAYTREPENEYVEDGYSDEEYPEDGYQEDGGQDGWGEDRRYPEENPDEDGPSRSPVTIEPEDGGEPQEQIQPAWTPIQAAQTMSDEALRSRIHEAEVQATLAMEMSRMTNRGFKQELEMAQTRVLSDIRDLNRGMAVPEARHLMIEAETPQEGLEKAVEALKKIHRETGAKNQAAKITGERLNRRGIFSIADKVTGKDLIIEQAGEMTEPILQELNQLIARDETGMNVVLIDNASQLANLYRLHPGLAKQFEYMGISKPSEIAYAPSGEDDRPVRHIAAHHQEPQGNQHTVSGQDRPVIQAGNPRQETAKKENAQPGTLRAEAEAPEPAAVGTGASSGIESTHKDAFRQEPLSGNDKQRESMPSGNPRPVLVQPVSGQEPASRPDSGRKETQRPGIASQDSVQQEAAPLGAPQPKASQLSAPLGAARQSGMGASLETPARRNLNQPSVKGEAAVNHPSSAIAAKGTDIGSKPQMKAPQLAAAHMPEDGHKEAKPQPAKPVPLKKESSKASAPMPPVRQEPDTGDDDEMDIDEFAQYACEYAGDIDCSISGKSMLALYERIEIMEEDGVSLTKANAEDLIEEAADRAENPSFFKRITGIFSSKYDRDGLLIFKEEHFI